MLPANVDTVLLPSYIKAVPVVCVLFFSSFIPPVDARAGTAAVVCRSVAVCAVRCTPLKYTLRTLVLVPKFVPVIVTTVFLGPMAGLMAFTVCAGACGATVSLFFLQEEKIMLLHKAVITNCLNFIKLVFKDW